MALDKSLLTSKIEFNERTGFQQVSRGGLPQRMLLKEMISNENRSIQL